MPLAQVVLELARLGQRLNELDDRIGANIREIEGRLRELGGFRVASVRLPDGADLAWSGARHRWRFVVRDGDHGIVDLLSSSRDERCEVFATGAMQRLVDALVAGRPR